MLRVWLRFPPVPACAVAPRSVVSSVADPGLEEEEAREARRRERVAKAGGGGVRRCSSRGLACVRDVWMHAGSRLCVCSIYSHGHRTPEHDVATFI